MVCDIFSFIDHNDDTSTSMSDPMVSGMTNNEEVEKIRKLMEDANILLYPGCEKMVKLEFLI